MTEAGNGQRYKILKRLASGGMGEVFLAYDEDLERKVALKVVAEKQDVPGLIERFEMEARAAAAIDHPFIGKIYDFGKFQGRPFIAMEYVDGETLKSRLEESPIPKQDALTMALECAEALEEAHRLGIVHRDLKPSNIMLTAQGHVKLVDFGLAKRIQLVDVQDDTLTTLTDLTQAGQILGTLHYMSPEQARGENVSHQSDLFSLGILIFEMLTGVNPFRKDTAFETVASILKEEPAPLDSYFNEASPALKSLVNSLLAKDLEKRCPSSTRLCEELRKLIRGGWTSDSPMRTRSASSIAVMPFDDLSREKDQQYFCDGLAEEIISALSALKGISVAARSSAFQFRDHSASVQEIGKALQVQNLLEGSVRKSGDRLRVSIRLLRVGDGYQLWAERFDGVLEDVFEMEDQISRGVLSRLQSTLAPAAEPVVKALTSNIEAYELYLKGRHYWVQRNEPALKKAVGHFQQALELDPDFALAWAGMADAYVTLGIYGVLPPDQLMPPAQQAVDRALQIQPDLAEAMTSRGAIRSLYLWDNESKADFKKALEINPEYATGYHWFANHYLLPRGHFDDARAVLGRARRFDPLSPSIHLSSGLQFYLEGRYGEAVRRYLKILTNNPSFGIAHYFLGLAHLEEGLHEEAIGELRASVTACGASSETLAALATALARAGRLDESQDILTRLKDRSADRYVSPVLLSQIYVALEDFQAAIQSLEQALETRACDLIWIKVKPLFAPLQGEKRFREICSAVGLLN